MHAKIPTQNFTKLIFFFTLTITQQLSAISSNMTHRVLSSSPLLYKMIDYSKHQNCFEVEPIYSGMYDSEHTISNLTPSGKTTLLFDQQGHGDINPTWINLISNNTLANYLSTVTLTPSMSQSGMLFHWYDQFDKYFIEIKTALVQCKSQIEILEIGGKNGLVTGVMNAQQAFNQASWNYGKIGPANHVAGLDDIELRFGTVSKATSNSSCYDLFISGFGIIQAPTGSGTKAEWLFEPQVGTNHWGIGLGFESLVSGDNDLKFMIAGNYRYLTPAWETRSFDLLQCGQWSRYLGLQDTYGLPTAPAILPLPGINYFTQQAYINGRSQLNLYARLQKQFKSSFFELSYNFLCTQQETIGTIKNINTGYGIYALTGPAGGAGGVTTAPTATINQDVTTLDPLNSPSTVFVNQFDKSSACAQTYVTNNLTARLEIKKKNVIYGFGASIESALSASAISTWSVWAQFGVLFDTTSNFDEENDRQLPKSYEEKEKEEESYHQQPESYDEDDEEEDYATDQLDQIPADSVVDLQINDLSVQNNELDGDSTYQDFVKNQTISLENQDVVATTDEGISLHQTINDSLNNNLIIPYDDHTIKVQPEQTGLLLQNLDKQNVSNLTSLQMPIDTHQELSVHLPEPEYATDSINLSKIEEFKAINNDNKNEDDDKQPDLEYLFDVEDNSDQHNNCMTDDCMAETEILNKLNNE